MVIYQAKKKQYYYLFSNDSSAGIEHPHIVNFVEPLNFEKMREVCSYFQGEHSFHNYQYKMNPNNTTNREIFDCQIIKNPEYAPHLSTTIYALEISGSGFLKQMVRIIMGALLNVGQEFTSPREVLSSFHPESPTKLGFIAPAHGLHLQKIHY